MTANQTMFNQPMAHERNIVENDGYITVREYLGTGWQPIRWIYEDHCGDWIISENQPFWLNDWGRPNGRLWVAEDREHAITHAHKGTHVYLGHHVSCACADCFPAD